MIAGVRILGRQRCGQVCPCRGYERGRAIVGGDLEADLVQDRRANRLDQSQALCPGTAGKHAECWPAQCHDREHQRVQRRSGLSCRTAVRPVNRLGNPGHRLLRHSIRWGTEQRCGHGRLCRQLSAEPYALSRSWEGSTNTIIYVGCSPSTGHPCVFDGGAIRIVNTATQPITVNSVVAYLGTCKYDLWGSVSPPVSLPVTLPVLGQLVLAQTLTGADDGCTANGHFDTSDVGPVQKDGGTGWLTIVRSPASSQRLT